jgi:hypothetical protein
MNTIENLSETTRRSLCAVMAVAIVAFGLTIGAIGADAAFQEAYVHATTTHVSVVQLASL